MSELQIACIWLVFWSLVLLAMCEIIDWLNRRRESDGKRIRDLIRENARLRAQLRGSRFDHEWEVDELKTQMAVKEMLLKQKWKGASK